MPRFGCFFAKSPKGGISDPKNFTADFFVFKTVYFERKFWKKFPKGGGGGGREINDFGQNFVIH